MNQKTKFEEVLNILSSINVAPLFNEEWWCNNGSINRPIPVIDSYGYKVSCLRLANIISGRDYKKSIFHTANKYTIENINLWCNITNCKYKLKDGQIYTNNNVKMTWICNKCGEFNVPWNQILQGGGCSVCCSREVNDINSIRTNRPDLIKYFLNEEDVDLYTVGSEKFVKLKCPFCGDIKSKRISVLTKGGFYCDLCSDNISIPEKFIINLLNQKSVKFIPQYKSNWSDNKRYDFYIPYLNMIIEVHGEQHYKYTGRGRSLKEEQANDLLKYNLAIRHGIKPENYIVIDCRKSELEWLKHETSIKLNKFFNLDSVDWYVVYEKSLQSNIIKAFELWNIGIKSSSEIKNILNVSKTTVIKYLKILTKIGKIQYNTKQVMIENGRKNGKINKGTAKEILQYSLDNKLIRKFNSVKEAGEITGYHIRGISDCANNKREEYKNFIWKFA